MPIELTAEEAAFVDRVDAYCAQGLTQPEMAAKENLTLSGFRQKLNRCGWEIDAHTTRRVVRLRTKQPLTAVKEAGEILIISALPEAA